MQKINNDITLWRLSKAEEENFFPYFGEKVENKREEDAGEDEYYLEPVD